MEWNLKISSKFVFFKWSQNSCININSKWSKHATSPSVFFLQTITPTNTTIAKGKGNAIILIGIPFFRASISFTFRHTPHASCQLYCNLHFIRFHFLVIEKKHIWGPWKKTSFIEIKSRPRKSLFCKPTEFVRWAGSNCGNTSDAF